MKKTFLTGLVTLLPLAVTLWILEILIRFLTKPFMGIVTPIVLKSSLNGWFHSEAALRLLSQLFILIALFLCVLLLGFFGRRYVFSKLLHWTDWIVDRIPLVNKVYKTSKEVFESLFSSQDTSLKQVVMVPFPYPGSYCLGLVSRKAPLSCQDNPDNEQFSVFVPTAPNPTTGFLVICPRSELIFLEMQGDAAIKYVISCGVIQPDEGPDS